MGFDLTNEAIQNTYQQLVQISGSTLVNGTGSAIPFTVPTASYATFAESATTASYALYAVSASYEIIKEVSASHADMADTASYADYAVTASYALNVPSIDTSSLTPLSTFNAYTSSNDASVASKLPTSTFNTYTSSNDASVASKLPTSTFNTYTSSVDSSLAGKLAISTFNSYTSSNDSIVNSLVAATSSYLTSLPSGVVSSSAQVDLSQATGTAANAVSASYAVTASYALNAAGGAGLVSGTGLDSMRSSDDLTTTPASAGGDYSIALGESATSAGTEAVAIGATTNAAGYRSVALGSDSQAGANSVAIGDSAGSNTSSTGVVSIGRNSAATSNNAIAIGRNAGADGISIGFGASSTNGAVAIGESISATNTNEINIGGIFKYNGSNTIDLSTPSLIKVPSNLVGGGAPSVSGNRRFVFGNNSSVAADDAVTIGGEANNVNASYCSNFGGASVTISSGDTSTVLGGYQHTINGGIRNAIIGGQGVTNNQDFSIVLGRQGYTTLSPYTTYTANLDVSGSVVVSGSVEVTGQIYSPTFAGSVASSTSSIDFNNGNFATLSLTSGTHIANPSNLKSGTTYTIIISSGSLIDSMGSAFKFAGGSVPTFSNGTDVLTMVSDGTSLYATALTDFQ